MPTNSAKIYQYIENGINKSVTVSVSIPDGCPGSGDFRYKDIQIDLSEPIGIDLPIRFDSVKTESSVNGSGTYNIVQYFTVPAGVQNHTASAVCHQRYSQGATIVNIDYEYTFSDQAYIPEGGEPLLANVASKGNVTCYGASNGWVNLEISGGYDPYTIEWSDGFTTNDPSRTGMPPGTYDVTVTDDDGVEVTIEGIVITQADQLQATITPTSVNCYGGQDGSINVTGVSGGTGGYSFLWSDGSTIKNRTNLFAGSYTLTITDSSNCSRSFNVTIDEPTRIEVTANIEGKDVDVSVSGGLPPYSYLWSDGNTLQDREGLANGTYSLTVRDSNLCQRTITIVINDFKFYFSENPVIVELLAENLGEPNLSFLADVYIEDDYLSDIFLLKFRAEHPAKTDGTTYFDFREVLNAFLQASLPEYAESNIIKEVGSFKRFYVQHTEKYGNPPEADPFTQIDTYYVLLGGLADQEHAKYIFFESYLDNQQPFLTWQPFEKEITEKQQEFLSYVVFKPGTTQLKFNARIHYDDDSEAEAQILTQNTVQPFEVYRFPAGYIQLNLASVNPAKTVVSYDLWLTDQADVVISEERSFVLIEDEGHYRTFLYLNSLGRWDTLLARGRGASRLKTDDEVIDRELPLNYNYSDAEQVVTSKTGQLDTEVVIGNLTNDERKHLVDLAISKRVYEITDSGYLPVQVKMRLNVHDDLNEMDEISFDVIPPITRKYTPEL